MPREARQFKVPDSMANLYEFANSIDLRCFTHHHMQHEPGDELTAPHDLVTWLSERRLIKPNTRVTQETFDAALALRSALRAYLACEGDERRTNKDVMRSLNAATRSFPLVAEADGSGITLHPARDDVSAGLARIVAELQTSAADGTLDRLKLCASEECRRAFFDRSKPGSRRWCVSTLCGNRIKTRTYRERHQA